MNAKLTLKLDHSAILRAKKYAKSNQDSLSGLVENFFNSITASQPHQIRKRSPVITSLAGVLKKSRVDLKDEYTDYLIKKYT